MNQLLQNQLLLSSNQFPPQFAPPSRRNQFLIYKRLSVRGDWTLFLIGLAICFAETDYLGNAFNGNDGIARMLFILASLLSNGRWLI
jgi:hypothetical protein